jgi:hypothetical protein
MHFTPLLAPCASGMPCAYKISDDPTILLTPSLEPTMASPALLLAVFDSIKDGKLQTVGAFVQNIFASVWYIY